MKKQVGFRFVVLLVLLLVSVGTAPAQFGPLPIYVGIPTMNFNFAAAQMQDEWCWAASTQWRTNKAPGTNRDYLSVPRPSPSV